MELIQSECHKRHSSEKDLRKIGCCCFHCSIPHPPTSCFSFLLCIFQWKYKFILDIKNKYLVWFLNICLTMPFKSIKQSCVKMTLQVSENFPLGKTICKAPISCCHSALQQPGCIVLLYFFYPNVFHEVVNSFSSMATRSEVIRHLSFQTLSFSFLQLCFYNLFIGRRFQKWAQAIFVTTLYLPISTALTSVSYTLMGFP